MEGTASRVDDTDRGDRSEVRKSLVAQLVRALH